MTNEQVYRFLRDEWVDFILNDSTELNLGIEINRAFENARAPDGRYIAISSEFARNPIGSSRKGPVDDVTGRRSLVKDYEFSHQIYEVNGDGDLLSAIIESRERADIIDKFTAANIALHRVTDILATPRLKDETFYIKESSVTLTYHVFNVIEENSGIIETVETTNEIVR